MSSAQGRPFVAPGDMRLRHDVQLLDDAGAIDVPLTTWPLAWGDLIVALDDIDTTVLNGVERAAYERLRISARSAMRTGEVSYRLAAGAAGTPRVIRSFEDTPREDAQLMTGLEWTGNRFAVNLAATYTINPADDDGVRPDGSYAGVALGNWMLSAGWQERWWGPGHDGSLILSTNARPVPALAIQRNRSTAFESRWLRWIGPWTLTGFMGLLDDTRTIDDTLLFGLRVAFRPVQSLEIGLSRTAQWCGESRPCTGSTFADLLLGNDNRGVNVDPNDEPGNQLGGIDIRWSLPGNLPLAMYAQWIAEDTRRGGPEIGSWLRQAGIEHWGAVGSLQHRTHIEVSDTACRDGGLGFNSIQPDCAYEHSIHRTGYRYNGRSIGHGIDGDGLSYSLGSTLVQSAGQTWALTLRYMDINRVGGSSSRHTLAAAPQELADLQLTHDRMTKFGRLYFGLGLSKVDNPADGRTSTDVTGFVQWMIE